MPSAVHVLRLSGLDTEEARVAVSDLLDNRDVPDLSHLLVLDDTSLLLDHVDAFEDLLTAGRLRHLVCVAIGPSDDNRQTVVVPGNISSLQGSAVLWVSDPLGIDWPLSASAVAVIRPARGRSGLDHLIEALSAVEVYSRVRELVIDVPGGVASPGLRIAGSADEGTSFAAALATAIRRLTAAAGQAGAQEPLILSEDARTGSARLAEHGKLSVLRDQCVDAADEAAATLGALSRSPGLLGAGGRLTSARQLVLAAGEQLLEFRAKVTELFEFAHAPGGLSDRQQQRVRDDGVLLPDPADHPEPGSADGRASAAVGASVRAGVPLPQIIARLTADERRLAPQGSRPYIEQIDDCVDLALTAQLSAPPRLGGPQTWMAVPGLAVGVLGSLLGLVGIATGLVLVACWAALLNQTTTEETCGSRAAATRSLAGQVIAALAGVAAGSSAGVYLGLSRPAALTGIGVAVLLMLASVTLSWRTRITRWQRQLDPARAASGADALAALVVRVATSEWSADRVLLAEIARLRIVVKGVNDQLRESADGIEKGVEQLEEPKLSGALAPTLRRLVLTVLARPAAQDRSDGQASFRQAKKVTSELIGSWVGAADDLGPLARPDFAQPDELEADEAADHDLSVINSVTLYDPYDVMWQLCGPRELTMLDTGARPAVVAFAPSMGQQPVRSPQAALSHEPVWTSSGMRAGLVRLVPLRDGGVEVEWSAGEREEPSA